MTIHQQQTSKLNPVIATVGESADAITVTAAALSHIKKSLAKRGAGIGIRLKVKTTGCSGNAYVVDYVDEVQADDIVFSIGDNLIVCVDPQSFALVKGTQIDYVRNGLNSAFSYTNPNVKGTCGCGESFTL